MSCPSCNSNETRIVGIGADERSPQAFRDAPARSRLCTRCGTVYEEPTPDSGLGLSLAPRVLAGGAPAVAPVAPPAAPSFGGLELSLEGSAPRAGALGARGAAGAASRASLGGLELSLEGAPRRAAPVPEAPPMLVADVVVLKKCPKCGHSAMVEPSPHASCPGCGRIYAKMEQMGR